MKQLRARYRTSILLISHDLGVIADMRRSRDRHVLRPRRRNAPAIDDLFDRPAHPYTEGLLNSIPSRSIGQERLYQIPALRPRRRNAGRAVAFYPRCPKRMPICLEQSPPLFQVSETQQAACFALAGGARMIALLLHAEGLAKHFAARSRWSAFGGGKSVVRAVDDLSMEIARVRKPWRWWASPAAASRRPAA